MLDLVFKNHITRPQRGRSNRRMTASSKAPGENFFRKILDTGAKELRIKDKKIEISINLVGDAKIKELNKKYRGKNKATDVLSFPLEEARFKKYAILPLGDIFICLPFAVKEAKRQDISLEKELSQLIVHGFLHLLGYDHEKSLSQAKKMEKAEKNILDRLNFLDKDFSS